MGRAYLYTLSLLLVFSVLLLFASMVFGETRGVERNALRVSAAAKVGRLYRYAQEFAGEGVGLFPELDENTLVLRQAVYPDMAGVVGSNVASGRVVWNRFVSGLVENVSFDDSGLDAGSFTFSMLPGNGSFVWDAEDRWLSFYSQGLSSAVFVSETPLSASFDNWTCFNDSVEVVCVFPPSGLGVSFQTNNVSENRFLGDELEYVYYVFFSDGSNVSYSFGDDVFVARYFSGDVFFTNSSFSFDRELSGLVFSSPGVILNISSLFDIRLDSDLVLS